MRLATAKQFVLEYGVVEIGQLLTNKGIIDGSVIDDDRTSYISDMFVDDNTSNDLESDIETELNRYIDRAQADVEPHLKRFYKWPLQSDGFDILQSDVPGLIVDIIQEITRYYLDDENTRHVEDVSTIYHRYKKALMKARFIGDGEYRLDLDEKYDDTKIPYVI